MTDPNSPYPKFIPPPAVQDRHQKEWSKKDAELFASWFHSVRASRVQDLLRYLQLSGEGDAEQVLERVGAAVVPLLKTPRFSEGVHLTNEGYALAADVGLLLVQFLEQALGDKVHWEVVHKPKNDADYHLPVLAGFKTGPMNPVRIGLNIAWGVISDERGPDAWAKVYPVWLGFA